MARRRGFSSRAAGRAEAGWRWAWCWAGFRFFCVDEVGVGVEGDVGLEDLEIAADIREAKSMVGGICGLLNGDFWKAVGCKA